MSPARPPAAAAPPSRPLPTPAHAPKSAAASPFREDNSGLPDQRIRQIYAKYIEAKRAANESTAGVTYEKLAQSLRAQAVKLRASHAGKSVDYEVVVKDGKTILKPIVR